MRALAWLPLAACAACASWPENWVDPHSPIGVHDRSDGVQTSSGGGRYRIQWRGDPAAAEKSMWRLDGDRPVAQVVPWGPWRSLWVTDDRTFFVRERGSNRWLRHRDGEPMVEMPGWERVFRAVSRKGVDHYVVLRERPAQLVHIAADGSELAWVAGDDFEFAGGGLLVRSGDELTGFFDRDLQPLTTGALSSYQVERQGRLWLVPTAAGVRVATAKAFVGHGPYLEIRAIRFADGPFDDADVVKGWAVRREGDKAMRLAGPDLEPRSDPAFVDVAGGRWLRPKCFPEKWPRERVVIAKVQDEEDPWRVLLWNDGLAEIAASDNLDGVIDAARWAIFRALDEKYALARKKRLAELDARIAAKRAAEEAERARQRELAEQRRLAAERAAAELEAFHKALIKGGLPKWEVERYEKQGRPMVVVGGKSYVGRRVVTIDDVNYESSIAWDSLPECFLWWDQKRWRSAIKVDTGDGNESVLFFHDRLLQALPKRWINGEYVVPVAAAELLTACGRCGGDGKERRNFRVRVASIGGGWQWEERRLLVGTAIREGNFVSRLVYVPTACNRCWGHGVVPHLPE